MADENLKKKANKSLGRECVAYGCSTREYTMLNGERQRNNVIFFNFPRDTFAKRSWCNLIKRQDGLDGFNITNSTRLCEKHFGISVIYKPPGGTRKRLLDGAKPILHAWNDFGKDFKKRKQPMLRASPRKKCRVQTPLQLNFSDEELEVTETPEISELDQIKEKLQNFKNDNVSLKNEKINLQAKCEQLEQTVNSLHQEIKHVSSVKCNFVAHCLSSDSICNYYTGFPTLASFRSVLIFLDAGELGENVILFNNQEIKGDSNRGRKRIFSPLESYLITLIKLRRNFPVKHLSYLFDSSDRTVSNTVITWVNFIYLKLGSMCIWPDRKKIQMLMPSSMKENFPTTRCIIDCLEFKVEVPSSLYVHKMLYSDYKSHTTVKVLVGIAPGGGFTFISSAYPGSISDKSIVIKSGFLHPGLWEKGDSVMADRGFTIEEYLKPLNVNLIIPAFLKGRGQFTTNEIVKSQQIARERIHVERMIQHLKCYHIFDQVVPVSMMGSINQIITVCGLLANFQNPILKNIT